ncbi:replication initiator protein A [Magnetococcales bacterium HHB-1]
MADLVKQDINLLEFPIWSVDKKDRRSEIIIKTKQGTYKFKANKHVGIPNAVDVNILYLLMLISQTQSSPRITLNRSQMIKCLQMPHNPNSYRRIIESLERWCAISIEFNGNFYSAGESYSKAGFHVLNYKIDKESAKIRPQNVTVSFDEDFYHMVSTSNFYKHIDLDQWVALKVPIHRRLYEILLKSFLYDRHFKISHHKLFTKLQTKIPQYPSQVKQRLKVIFSAIEAINKYDEQYLYTFRYDINDSKVFICYFTREEMAPEQAALRKRAPKLKSLIEQFNLDQATEPEPVPSPPVPVPSTLQDDLSEETVPDFKEESSEEETTDQSSAIQALMKRGVQSRMARTLVEAYSIDIVRLVIEDFDLQPSKDSFRNPGGYLVSMFPKDGEEYVCSIYMDQKIQREKKREQAIRDYYLEEVNRKIEQFQMVRAAEIFNQASREEQQFIVEMLDHEFANSYIKPKGGMREKFILETVIEKYKVLIFPEDVEDKSLKEMVIQPLNFK